MSLLPTLPVSPAFVIAWVRNCSPTSSIKLWRLPERRALSQIGSSIVDSTDVKVKIERKFAELKRFHGLKEARYWSLAKMAIQFTMTAIACNLKRIVKLLFHRGCLGSSKPGGFHQGITVPILA